MTLQLTELDGEVIKEDEDSDPAAGIWKYSNLRPGPKRVQMFNNGRPVGPPQTIEIRDNTINRFQADTSGGRITTVSSSGTPSSNGVTVIGQNRAGTAGFHNSLVMFSLSLAQSFASIGNSIEASSSSNGGNGKDIESHTTSLRGDVRVFPFGAGNIGNLILGNLALDDCYLGLQGAIGLTSEDRGGKFDFHGGGGEDDTFIDRKLLGSATPYAGCKVADIGNSGGYLNVHAGPRIQINRWIFETLQSQGGSNDERTKRTETSVGVAVGAEVNFPFGDVSPGGLDGGFQAGLWGTYMTGTDFTETTGVGTYDIDTDGYAEVTGRLGFYLKY